VKAHSPDPALNSCTAVSYTWDGASRQDGKISRKDAKAQRLGQKHGIAAKRRKKTQKENERKITGGTGALWREGNHLPDIGG
jgi:hypothetical protein